MKQFTQRRVFKYALNLSSSTIDYIVVSDCRDFATYLYPQTLLTMR